VRRIDAALSSLRVFQLRIPDIPHRDYQLIRNDKIDGVAIDRDLTKSDNFGGSVLWLSIS
jgi:hypothetical protein